MRTFRYSSAAVAALAGCLSSAAHAQRVTVPASAESFDRSGAATSSMREGTRFGEFLGRRAVSLSPGLLIARGTRLRDGVIEVDVAAQPRSFFLGVAFRVESAANLEMIYFRPSASDTREAMQYTPRLNGDAIWQLLNSDHEKATAHIVANQWMHVKIAIRGRRCQVFLNGGSVPTLSVTNLRRGDSQGGVGLWALGGGGYFSNLSVTPFPDRKPLQDLPLWKRPGLLSDWELSPALDAGDVDPAEYPVSVSQWEPVHAEDPGFVLINRYRDSPAMFPMPSRAAMTIGRVRGAKLVFARTHLVSAEAMQKLLTFGYSDDIVIYLNRRRIYSGKNALSYRSDDALGTFGLNDRVNVLLHQGDNELLVAVTEYNGGWAFECVLQPLASHSVR